MFKVSFTLVLLVTVVGNSQSLSDAAKESIGSGQENTISPKVGTPIDLETTDDSTYSITITVTNIRNRQGVIRFKFYDDTTPFPDDNGFRKVVVPKTEMRGDSLTVVCYGFRAQHMGIALQDDENNNLVLEFGWLLPKEGYAFSDYYHSAWRRPVYSDFSFFLHGDRHVVMRMKYY